jgi:hypothetical protein
LVDSLQDAIQKYNRMVEENVDMGCLDVFMFNQSWGSTSLGFGGIGGQVITSAYTVVIRCGLCTEAFVYFGGGFAYCIEKPNDKFLEDLSKHQMASRMECGKYRKE